MKYEKRESNTIKKVKNTPNSQPNNPLHGVRLDAILNSLIDAYGWEELGRRIKINCFTNNPTLNSSLKFLRKTPWAREKVEDLYLKSIEKDK
ncbi:MAG: VF530 family DNA-binding protein [Lishizhenia sp.]